MNKLLRTSANLVLFVSALLAAAPPVTLDWALTGPSDGAVTDIVESPAGRLFAATSKGLYQSTDDGIGWSQCGDARGTFVLLLNDRHVFVGPSATGQMSYVDESCATREMVVLPPAFNSPKTIDALARLRTGRLLASRWGVGLFASDDDGRTWRHVPLPGGPNAAWVSSIVTVPSGHVIASASGRMLRSTDNGNNWTTTGAQGIPRLAVAPSGTLFGAGNGVWTSPDEGTTWSKVAFDRQTVWAILPGRNVMVAAVQRRDRFDNAVYRSTDSGVTWTPGGGGERMGRVNALLQTSKGSLIAGTSTGFFRSAHTVSSWDFHGVAPAELRVLAAGEGIVAAGTPGAWISTDAGRTWLSTLITYQESDRFHGIGESYPRGFLITRTGRIFAGGQNGVLLSLDRGRSWRRVGLTRDTQALCELADGTVVAATWHGGIFRSTDQGETWTEHSRGLTDFTVIGLSVLSSGPVLAATLHEVFVSTDSARSWQPLTAGLKEAAMRPVLPSGEGAVAVAGVGATVYELDEARTWNRAATLQSPVTSLAWDGTGRLWIGTKHHGVVMARKVGDAWTTADLGGPVAEINALSVSQGYLVATTTYGLYRAELPPL